MKKLFTILMLIGLMSVSAQSQSINYLTQTVDYSYVEIRFELNDTVHVQEVYLYWNGALKDSINSSWTSPDTFTVTALEDGKAYDFYLKYIDTTAAGATVTYVDRTHSATTTDYVQVIGDSAVTLSSAYCYWDSSAADTGIVKLVLITDTANPPTTRQDSSLSSNRVDTSFALTGLMNGTTYYYYFEATDSAITDSSAIGNFTTIDFTGALTLVRDATTLTNITITVTPDTATDFNGVDSINLFEGVVADSFLDVATVTLAETVTVALWDTTAIDESDSLFFYWGTIRDSVLELNVNFATDTSLGDSASPSVIKSGLASITEYYYSAVVCSVNVWDTIAIDSVTTTSLSSASFSRTGKFRGGQYHYWAQLWDSIYVDSLNNDSISIPLLSTWKTSDMVLTWNNPSYMPSHSYSVNGIETVYYNCWMTGATYRDADSLKLFVYDDTWGLEIAIDSSGFIVTDTITIAVDSVACNNKDLITFKMVARHPTAIDDVVGELKMHIEIQDRPF